MPMRLAWRASVPRGTTKNNPQAKKLGANRTPQFSFIFMYMCRRQTPTRQNRESGWGVLGGTAPLNELGECGRTTK